MPFAFSLRCSQCSDFPECQVGNVVGVSLNLCSALLASVALRRIFVDPPVQAPTIQVVAV